MNNTNLIGRLTKEGDLRITQNGTQVYRNSIAVNRKFKKDEADFINILAFKQTAELMTNHLNKGDQVGIEGHINTGSYEKDGKKIYTFEVVVDGITFIGGKKQDKPQQQNTARVDSDPFSGTDIDDPDGLPF